MYVDMFPPPVLDCTARPERVGHIRISTNPDGQDGR
jgi:hypothetical protein